MIPWLAVIGIGEDGLDGLSPAARALVEQAEVLVGGQRHLTMIPDSVAAAERLVWGTPFPNGVARILERRGRRTCVLASGDPMWFGVGSVLARNLPAEDMLIVPQAGAFSLAAARLGWGIHECAAVTVHGRPLELINLHLAENAKLLILSEDGRSPARVAELLRQAGYGPSRMVVFERLGGAHERRLEGLAAEWEADCHDLNTIAVECHAEAGTRGLSRLAGLPDDAYRHDGQLTKREVRAVTLAALAPMPGALLWDVGAGCGSIAIEWMRACGRAVAIERDAGRATLIAANALVLGVPRLVVRHGEAPRILSALDESPDAVFVGGGASVPDLLETCWELLKPGGRLVANTVTVEGEAALLAFHARQGGELTRLAVTRLKRTGGYNGWHALAPVTQYCGCKP